MKGQPLRLSAPPSGQAGSPRPPYSTPLAAPPPNPHAGHPPVAHTRGQETLPSSAPGDERGGCGPPAERGGWVEGLPSEWWSRGEWLPSGWRAGWKSCPQEQHPSHTPRNKQ